MITETMGARTSLYTVCVCRGPFDFSWGCMLPLLLLQVQLRASTLLLCSKIMTASPVQPSPASAAASLPVGEPRQRFSQAYRAADSAAEAGCGPLAAAVLLLAVLLLVILLLLFKNVDDCGLRVDNVVDGASNKVSRAHKHKLPVPRSRDSDQQTVVNCLQSSSSCKVSAWQPVCSHCRTLNNASSGQQGLIGQQGDSYCNCWSGSDRKPHATTACFHAKQMHCAKALPSDALCQTTKQQQATIQLLHSTAAPYKARPNTPCNH